MSLNKNFCPSPWFHMRIKNDGSYNYCRWSSKDKNYGNIKDILPTEYFKKNVQPIRDQFLKGEFPKECSECHKMEQHGKVTGRQRQLLKIGVREEFFEKSLKSSPWFPIFNKPFDQLPQDWQIDLGNYCNSNCVFCHPNASSKLATEWKTIGFINKLPPKNWVDHPELIQKFLDTLSATKSIKYLHFIGGETVITPAFKKILSILIDMGLHKKTTIGFTTNLISWDNEVIELLKNFESVNLGMSVEAFDRINDYVRYPSTIEKVKKIFHDWLLLSNKHKWLVQLRTTPTILSLHKLTTVYDIAWHNNIAVESCNFLENPKFLKPSVLPVKFREKIIQDIAKWINEHSINMNKKIINTRDENIAKIQIVQDLTSYLNYLKNEPDESFRLPEMCHFLNKLDANRNNSVIDYIPEYEELFRTNGYKSNT